MNEFKETQSGAGAAEVSLWDIARLLLSKFYWLLIAGLAAGVGVYFAVTFLVTPTYESRISFYVYNSANNNTSQPGTINNSDLQAAESLATTYSKILESNSVLDAVLKDLGEGNTLSRKELSDMVKVAVVSDTQLLEVVIASPGPSFACKIADSFAKVAPVEIVRITKAGGVEIVDWPEIATEKSAPRTVFDSALGVIVGAMIAALIIVLRAAADTTVYLPDDIEKVTDAAVLGQIPDINVTEGSYNYWALTEGGAIRHDEEEK